MWIDYRNDIKPLFEGGINAVGQAMWVVLRIMRLGEYSQYWDKNTHEAVGGSKWNYDDYLARAIWIPGASLKSTAGGTDIVINAGVDNTDVKVYAIQFDDLIRPGNARMLCQDDILYEIDKFASASAPQPPLIVTSRFKIIDTIPVNGDNGRIELVYIVAQRAHGES